MAQSVNINQRIILVGGDDVNRQLENIAKAGQDMGQKLQQATQQATTPLKQLTTELDHHEVSAKAARYAVQNLTFQINDVVTSLASGISPFRTFTQQGGQFVQLFQQGGGVGNVLGTFARGVAAWLTPARLATGALAGLTAGVGVLLDRVLNSQDRIRTFGVVLSGLGRGPNALPEVLRGGVNTARINTPAVGVTGTATGGFAADLTPQKLEESSQHLRDVGLNFADASKALTEALRALNNVPNIAIGAKALEGYVRTGQNLNTVLGDGSAARFISAIGSSGQSLKPLQDIAQALRIPTSGLENASTLIDLISKKVKDANENALDPFSRKWRDLKIDIDNAENSIIRFFQEGLVNARETGGAFNQLVDSLGGAIQRGEFTKIATVFTNAFKPPDTRQFLTGLFEDAKRFGTEFYNILNGEIDKVSGKFSGSFSNLPKVINSLLDTVTLPAAKISADLGRSIGSVLPTAVTTAFEGLQKVVGDLEDKLVGVWTRFQNAAFTAIGYVQGILNDLLNLANKFSGPGATIKPVASAAIPSVPSAGVPDLAGSGGFAIGGLIHGPGSGTSDSIWARISNGEYIVNAAATRANLPILEAINSIGRPVRSGRGFADGGLFGGGAILGPGAVDARTRFTLVIEGRHYFGIDAPDSTVNALLKHAQTSTMISTGPSPSWRGGR